MNEPAPGAAPETAPRNMHFIREMIAEDIRAGRNGGKVVTRFPPEPNGYLHIGHAKAFCLDFGMALENGGVCHLRMDDTNPVREDIEYTEAIQKDIRWLGFDWGPHFYHASDYFGKMYDLACQLIRDGKAYVCSLTAEQWKEHRGIPTEPGKPSPWRDTSPEENLALFERMRAGEFADGEKVLRAKIDMASPNLHMRDPVIYRILHATHPHTGDAWCIYPMYDFAHPIEDALEGVTHSLCTLEFEVHRPLYDWVIRNCHLFPSRQTEFARLSLTYTVMSKRKLLELVQTKLVNGWDDPRMPTLCGLRRRGVPPEAIRAFCETIGITKYDSLTDVAVLEHCIRDALNKTARRAMAVLDPLKVVIENPADVPATVRGPVNPEDPAAGEREIPFGPELRIEREDFAEVPPPKYFRLSPGKAVRLRYAGFLECTGVDKAPDGTVAAVRGRFIPMTEKVKVKATIHWVPASARPVEVRLYDRLFNVPEPDADKDVDFKTHLNPDSLKTATALVEPSLLEAAPGDAYQFERIGYFAADPDSKPGAPVFNRTVTLKDSWKGATGQ
ncbi:MAG: glutamine--tRNA ligase/YqeY domain fusion protein [Kiritimatiellae bacterium]|nr:glutamine--tRNA ligase/YqeY domain fusion protein [Kiritimatiellia bacterium]MBR4253382.1 glutamine--tRNA ligase/YqeY domain fusion protein [Kiritimatiellia bacterium]